MLSDTGSRFSEVIFGVTSSSIVCFRCLDLISGNIFLGLLENNHIANKKCLEANWSEEMMVYPICSYDSKKLCYCILPISVLIILKKKNIPLYIFVLSISSCFLVGGNFKYLPRDLSL